MPESLLDKLERWGDAAERRRAELLRSIEDGDVAEPITGTIFTIAVLKGILVSAAISIGTSLLTRALTPRQKFTTGQLQGTLQVPQSDQGLPIVEGYGADPASKASAFQASHAYALEDRVTSGGYLYVVTTAGTSAGSAPAFPAAKGAAVASNTVTFTNYGRTGGGFRLPMLIVYASSIRKHVTKVKQSGGGKGPKQPEQTEISYDLDLGVMPGRGPLRVKRIRANTDTIYQNYVAPAGVHEAEDAGNTLTNASVITTSYASGGQTVQMNTSTGAVSFPGVRGYGSSTQIGIGYVASGARTCEIRVNGSLVTTVTLPGSGASLGWYVATVNVPETAGNVVKLTNTSAAGGAILYLDRISVGGVLTPTGVPDPYIPVDDPFDPETPPDPNVPHILPTARFSGELAVDGTGTRTGNLLAGAYAGVSVYPGNTSQLPDPTIQAAVDAQYGSDSTPAFLNRCLVVLSNFYLTKYGGAIPLISTLAEHETLDTLELIFGHFCERVGVLESTDYDFSGVRRVFVRGFPVTPPYNPADVMEELARVFNVYFFEGLKIYARVRGGQAVVAALTSANFGWVDGDSDDEEQELPSFGWDIPTETEIARRYEMTGVDPDRDFEQNSQGTSRQITLSEKTERIELALTLYPEEMREVTQRELYEEEVQSTKHSLQLDWTYLYLMPGDSITVAEDDGTTSRIFIENIKPNVGVIPVEGSAEETAVYSQPVSTSGGGVFEVPPVPIPGQTIVGFYDNGALRTQEAGLPGFYVWAVKRTGDGEWNGAALYKETPGDPQHTVTFTKEATTGVALTKLGAWSDTSLEDSTHVFTADAVGDMLLAEDNEFQNGETVMLSNAGGALPGGLSATVLYYVIASGPEFQVSLTPGGAAVDVTSAGTGTHSVQRVVEVDLYGTEATLESVTAEQIGRGDNAMLWGDEILQPRTCERVEGFSNRWRCRNFTRGIINTEGDTASHQAGERVLLLDDAVVFVGQDVAAINNGATYRAVTAGQSYDDAAEVDFAWTGGALKYPRVSIQGTLDDDGNWRFLLFGEETRDPEGERYQLEIVDSPRAPYILRGAASRPVSLSLDAALADDMVPPPAKGGRQFRDATYPGNTVTGGALLGVAVYVAQMITGERTALSFTYRTSITDADSPATRICDVTFSPGAVYSLSLSVFAETSADPAKLEISDNQSGVVFTDGDGEATGTRYTVEFRDGKVKFYRNRHLHLAPFYVYTPPVPGEGEENDFVFPMEAQVVAAPLSEMADIEIDDQGAALLYSVEEQEADFGSPQTTITVRASQQRVIGGVVIDGRMTEVSFP